MDTPKTVSSTSDERTVNNVVGHEYRVLSDEEKGHMKAIKDKAEELIEAIRAAGTGREYSLAITKAEEAAMWGVKGLVK